MSILLLVKKEKNTGSILIFYEPFFKKNKISISSGDRGLVCYSQEKYILLIFLQHTTINLLI